ncbi:hypothetical protein ACA910_008736 [Epithemia clementina (nom. ined.)]
MVWPSVPVLKWVRQCHRATRSLRQKTKDDDDDYDDYVAITTLPQVQVVDAAAADDDEDALTMKQTRALHRGPSLAENNKDHVVNHRRKKDTYYCSSSSQKLAVEDASDAVTMAPTRYSSHASGGKSHISNHGNSNNNSNNHKHNINHKPLAYHLARQWAWMALDYRCQTHAHEISPQSIDEASGDTILHWTVFGNPPSSVVRNLLHACPDLASTPNFAGALPLHVACSYRASAPVLACLVKAYPEAAGLRIWKRMPTARSPPQPPFDEDDDEDAPAPLRRFPLHILCDYGHSDPNAFAVLLSTKDGVRTVSEMDPLYGLRPLSVWNFRKNMTQCQVQRDRMRSSLQKAILDRNTGILKATNGTNMNEWTQPPAPPLQVMDSERQSELQNYQQSNFWQVASLLIVAEYEQRPLLLRAVEQQQKNDDTEDDNHSEHAVVSPSLSLSPWRIVRAAICNPNCPPSLQEYAILAYHPYLMATLYNKPSWPYKNNNMHNVPSLSSSSSFIPNDDDDGTGPIHWAAQHGSADLLLDLLQICPHHAAYSSKASHNNGIFPLRLALQNPRLTTMSRSSWSSQQRKQQRGSSSCCWSALLEANPEAVAQVIPELLGYALLPQLLMRLACAAAAATEKASSTTTTSGLGSFHAAFSGMARPTTTLFRVVRSILPATMPSSSSPPPPF